MSIDATIWAWKAPVDSSTQRLVLLALADRAGEDHKAWPSAERLHQDTCLNIKTVPKILQELVKLGLIEDTKERKGSSNRVPVYRLIGVLDRVTGETPQKRDTPKNGGVGRTQKRNTPENGTHPKTGESDQQQASENTPDGQPPVSTRMGAVRAAKSQIAKVLHLWGAAHPLIKEAKEYQSVVAWLYQNDEVMS